MPVHVLSDQCVLTNDCDDGVFINTLKHITEVSHHDGCHLYHLPATAAAALINLFTHVNIVTGVLHQQELGYFCAKYFMGPTSRCAAVEMVYYSAKVVPGLLPRGECRMLHSLHDTDHKI